MIFYIYIIFHYLRSIIQYIRSIIYLCVPKASCFKTLNNLFIDSLGGPWGACGNVPLIFTGCTLGEGTRHTGHVPILK